MIRIRQIVAVSALCFATGAAPAARHSLEAQPQEKAVRGVPAKVTAPDVAPISLSDADGQDLVLEELSAHTAIEGMLSLTELDLRFRNPAPACLEGGDPHQGVFPLVHLDNRVMI